MRSQYIAVVSDLAAELDAIRDRRAVCDRSDRGFLAVSCRDALALLQNTITQDVARLEVGAAAPSLMLTPKGRPLADMLVVRMADDAYLLICEPQAQEPLAQTLRRYRLASKAAIDDARPETAMLEVFGAAPVAPGALTVAGPLGPLLVGPPPAVAAARNALVADGFLAVGPEAREVERIERGVPLHGSDFDESTLPAEAALTGHSIAFEKGCYIGQEPVARLHYRGHANRLLWRANLQQRLDAEALRDALLAVSGQLDPAIGGSSLPLTDTNRRRTIYAQIGRTKLDPLLALFDFPNPNATSEQRMVTIGPMQRLYFMNNSFVALQSKALADRLAASGGDVRARVTLAYRLLFARVPTASELNLGVTFLEHNQGSWPQYTQVLLSSTEFSSVN